MTPDQLSANHSRRLGATDSASDRAASAIKTGFTIYRLPNVPAGDQSPRISWRFRRYRGSTTHICRCDAPQALLRR